MAPTVRSTISLFFFTTLLPSIVTSLNPYNGMLPTPQMGWDTYNAYAYEYNETTITENARLLTTLGFRDLGYNVVIFDDAMTEINRTAAGLLVEDHNKFPGGLKNLADSLHASGLKFGVYSSAGTFTCGGWPGSLGHETEDAQYWASLGADYLKYDNCFNEGQSGTPQISQARYATMSKALNATGRAFEYSLCNWGDDKHEVTTIQHKPWEWASGISNSARISGDVQDSFDMPTTSCPCGPEEFYCELPGAGCSVMNILGKASHYVSKAQPGYWNDLDMLEVGNGAMTYDEYKTHFSMWAAVKSPLIMGNKLNELSPEDYAILINPAVLALNQDPLGSSARRVVVDSQGVDQDQYGLGDLQVWSGNLYGGDQVVAFINSGNTTRTMTYSLVDIFGGLRTAPNAKKSWQLYDLWGNQTVLPSSSAAMILNGTATIEEVDGGKWYYNSTAPGNSWAEGLMRNDTLLLGTPAGTVAAGGSISAMVPRHGVAIWRLKSTEQMLRKRDEL